MGLIAADYMREREREQGDALWLPDDQFAYEVLRLLRDALEAELVKRPVTLLDVL